MCEINEIIPSCGPNVPGVAEIYWAKADTVDSIPAVNASTLVISTDITMTSTNTFKKLVLVREDSLYEEEMAGPTDSNHHMYRLTGRVKGMTAAVDADLNLAVGAPIIVLAKFHDGSVRLIGNKVNFAEIITLKSSSGKTGSTDKKGAEIVIESKGHAIKAPYYTGEIPL